MALIHICVEMCLFLESGEPGFAFLHEVANCIALFCAYKNKLYPLMLLKKILRGNVDFFVFFHMHYRIIYFS
jgi:hypothetical protein